MPTNMENSKQQRQHEQSISVKCRFKGKNLDKKDWFGKSDPYLIISRICDNGSLEEIHRTPYIRKTLDPAWEPFEMTLVASGRREVQLKISCFNWDKNKQDDLIGEFYTTLSHMMGAKTDTVTWDLINPRKLQNKKNYKNSGYVLLTEIELVEES